MSATPGPWYLTRNGYGSIVCAKAATILDISPGLTHLDIVARTDWGRGEEDEANARLIAAAPDLLDWLKRCLDQAQGRGPPDWDGIRAVIAKAEGAPFPPSPQGGIG